MAGQSVKLLPRRAGVGASCFSLALERPLWAVLVFSIDLTVTLQVCAGRTWIVPSYTRRSGSTGEFGNFPDITVFCGLKYELVSCAPHGLISALTTLPHLGKEHDLEVRQLGIQVPAQPLGHDASVTNLNFLSLIPQ